MTIETTIQQMTVMPVAAIMPVAAVMPVAPVMPVTAVMPVAHRTHCGSHLKVAITPSNGPCSVCEEDLEVSIHTRDDRDMPDANEPGYHKGRLGWLLVGMLLITLLVVILYNELNVRLSTSDVSGYEDRYDNRFTGWPWSSSPNPDCSVPMEILAGLCWDDGGSSHALVAASYILTSHNSVPSRVYFRSADGRSYTRKTTDSYTMARDSSGLPFIRLCRLDEPLPPTVAPLPILTFEKDTRFDGDLLVFGRQGRIGHESGAQVSFTRGVNCNGEYGVLRGELSTDPDFEHQGQIRLRPGDSGSPVLFRVNGQWTLAALACATRFGKETGKFRLNHLYAVPGPHLMGMRAAGAAVSAVPIQPDSGQIRRVAQNTSR